jgi:Putative sensor
VTAHELTAHQQAPAVSWWRMPFTADTWRRTGYTLLAAPVGVLAVPLALLGGYRAAARWQRALARRHLALRVDEPAHRDTVGRVLAHALLRLPLDLLSLAVTAYLWLLVLSNLAYPVRPYLGMGDGSYQTAWGGPTLAGAWAVHAAGGLVFLFAIPWILKGTTALQGRLTRRLLGAGRYPDR